MAYGIGDRELIVVVGYPRSGNSWTAQLLGEALNSPVGGLYTAKPLCEEGQDRSGRFYVAQLHLRITEDTGGGPAIPSAWTFVPKRWKGEERIVFVVRDPRDVAVSAWHYWQLPSLEDAVTKMAKGAWPLSGCGPWSAYVMAWKIVLAWMRSDFTGRATVVRYEDLKADTEGELRRVLSELSIAVEDDAITKAVERQSFARKRELVERFGNGLPYGRDVQLRHLRKGIVGDWRQYDWRLIGPFANAAFADGATAFGYEWEENWWANTPCEEEQ